MEGVRGKGERGGREERRGREEGGKGAEGESSLPLLLLPPLAPFLSSLDRGLSLDPEVSSDPPKIIASMIWRSKENRRKRWQRRKGGGKTSWREREEEGWAGTHKHREEKEEVRESKSESER
jgi:hypothetical protein